MISLALLILAAVAGLTVGMYLWTFVESLISAVKLNRMRKEYTLAPQPIRLEHYGYGLVLATADKR